MKSGLHTLEECAEDENTAAASSSSDSSSASNTDESRHLSGARVGNDKQKRPTRLFSASRREHDSSRPETIDTAKQEAETESGNDSDEVEDATGKTSKAKGQGWPPGKKVNFQVKVARSPEPTTENLVVQSDDV